MQRLVAYGRVQNTGKIAHGGVRRSRISLLAYGLLTGAVLTRV